MLTPSQEMNLQERNTFKKVHDPGYMHVFPAAQHTDF